MDKNDIATALADVDLAKKQVSETITTLGGISKALDNTERLLLKASAPLPPTQQISGVTQKQIDPNDLMTPGSFSPNDRRLKNLPTEKQLRFIDALCDEKDARVTRKLRDGLETSKVISHLMAQPNVAESDKDPNGLPSWHRGDPASQPVEKPDESSKLEYNAMRLIEDGRYAVTSNDGKQTSFLRVKTDKKTGARIVQAKSSDVWMKLQTYYPSGSVLGQSQHHGSPISDLLTQIMLDPGECADRYGARYSECVNCGKELTDDKSRYYRLGSDCIQRRPSMVEYIDEKYGAWTPGAASRD